MIEPEVTDEDRREARRLVHEWIERNRMPWCADHEVLGWSHGIHCEDMRDIFARAIAIARAAGNAEGRREGLTFDGFADINRRRCESYNGFSESLQSDSKYTEAHWALSIASEAGEVADSVLGWLGLKRSKAAKTKDDIGRELADVVTYCDLLASKLGFRLSDLIVSKFNEVNARCDFGTRFAIAARNRGGA